MNASDNHGLTPRGLLQTICQKSMRAMSQTVRWILKSHLVRVEFMTSTIGA